jgi:Flp pilus assembly pilin Flp
MADPAGATAVVYGVAIAAFALGILAIGMIIYHLIRGRR